MVKGDWRSKMVSHNRDEFILNERKGLDTTEQVAGIVDEIVAHGYSNIFFVGIGGTYAYASQIVTIIKSYSEIPVYFENAADIVTTGNRLFTRKSVMIIESVSGDTEEIVKAVTFAREIGARVVGYVEKKGSPLTELVDYLVNGNAIGGGHYFRYAIALRFMYCAGDFPEYESFYKDMQNFPEALCNVIEKADEKAVTYAERYQDAPLQYIVGGGNLAEWAYSFAMCILEEMQWMRTKSVSAPEFFHGTIEVIEKDTCVLLLKGEDAARPLADRVDNFVNRVSANFTVFDTKDYELNGINDQFRGLLSPLVMKAICGRISKNFEYIRRHPLEIRRYYRRLNY